MKKGELSFYADYIDLEKQNKELKAALKHSKITFDNIIKTWILVDQQKKEIQSNIDYLTKLLNPKK